jgi:type I restriction enzyme, S subunit
MRKQEFGRYEVYQNCQHSWLNKIPQHWRMERVKNLTKTQSGTTPQSGASEYYENGTNYWVRTTDLNNDRLYSSEYKITDLALNNYGLKSIPVNSVLLAMYGGMGTIGKNSILKDKVTINQSVCAVLPNDKRFESIYFWYYVQYFRPHWEMFADSARKDPNINQEAIKRLWVTIPPFLEQKAIGDYLDTKTAQIDHKIDLLTQKATQYGKLKQSLISETVTRGLDKTVAMKDSGVEWIGEVPEHWAIERIGTAFEERREKVNDTDYPPLSVTMKGIVPQLDTAAKTDHNDNRKRVVINDFVINSRSDRRGSSGVSELNGSVSVINIVLTPRKNFFGKYLHHLFRSYCFIEEFYRIGRGIVDDLWTTKYSVMKAIDFSFPEYEEQKAIADYLDTKSAQIDSLVKAIHTQIEKLKELRKTLINDVVTGKIKVALEGETQHERTPLAR